ncbi:hypothetical protein [Alkanindiges illinoisensis]|uniref:hypothetical protein n=1 Tax=Alkanindiges illinoisensis TaxID=197183 RepID=UPI00047904CE|nr:hypothetical protein [Alkanindiges illinoisensis]
MTIQDHPSFAANFQRLFIWAWLIDTGLFVSSLYSLKHHYIMLGWTLAVGFGVFTVFILGYGYYQLFHIICPNCGGPTTTQKNNTQQIWMAKCKHCNVIWNLKIGTKRVD